MKDLTEVRTLNGVRQFRLTVDEHWLAFDDETVQKSPVMSAVARLAEYEHALLSKEVTDNGT